MTDRDRPAEGAWCWVWHVSWRQIGRPPQLVIYRIDTDVVDGMELWWTEEGWLGSDELTHWMPATLPVPPAEDEETTQ